MKTTVRRSPRPNLKLLWTRPTVRVIDIERTRAAHLPIWFEGYPWYRPPDS